MRRLATELADSNGSLRLLLSHGLQLSMGLRQIGNCVEFEVPARLAGATMIGKCRVGAFSYAGHGCEIRNTSIGRFCSIAANVVLGPAEHPTDWLSSHPFQFDGVRYFDAQPGWDVFSSNRRKFMGNGLTTSIGNDVWIGRNAIVRQGVEVGDGAIIAGGSFVNRDVPPYAVVAGSPARLIRLRFPEPTIGRLVALGWWNYELDPNRHELDFSDMEALLPKLESLVAKGALNEFKPKVRRLVHCGGTYSLFEGE